MEEKKYHCKYCNEVNPDLFYKSKGRKTCKNCIKEKKSKTEKEMRKLFNGHNFKDTTPDYSNILEKLDTLEKKLDTTDKKLDMTAKFTDISEERLDGSDHRLNTIERRLDELDEVIRGIPDLFATKIDNFTAKFSKQTEDLFITKSTYDLHIEGLSKDYNILAKKLKDYGEIIDNQQKIISFLDINMKNYAKKVNAIMDYLNE